MSFASMQSMANQRAINQKPRRRKPQPRPEWGADPAPRAAMGGSRGPSGPGASWDGSMGLPKIGAGSPTAGARREVVHGRRASGSSTPGGGRSGTPGAGRRGPGGRGRSLHGGGRGGGPVAKQGAAVEPEPAPMPAPPSLLEQAPMPTEEQIMSMTDEEVEEMIAKVRKQSTSGRSARASDCCLL